MRPFGKAELPIRRPNVDSPARRCDPGGLLSACEAREIGNLNWWRPMNGHVA
jgi:hypothetical protein